MGLRPSTPPGRARTLLIEKGVKLTCGRPWGTNPPVLPPVKTGVTLLPHLQQGRRL